MHSDIVERVSKCVAEVLAIEPSRIAPRARLMEDLGAESLDLVELMYLLEEEFAVRMEQDDMRLTAQLGLPDEEIHHQEVLTPKALAALRERFPHATEELREGMRRKDLSVLLTVEQVAFSVQHKLEQSEATSP